MTTLCACECAGCPLLPHCDGCDPPRLATSTLDAARRERDAARADAARARADLHAALCEGAFRIDRDPMGLVPMFEALRDQHVSCGWARTAARRWLAGLPVVLPEYPTEGLTFDQSNIIEHLARIAAGLEYDADGRAYILDTDVMALRGAIVGLREAAAESEARAADLAREVERLRVALAEVRANVDASR